MGILPYILGVTGKAHRVAIVHLLEISVMLFCKHAQFYLDFFIYERKRGIEDDWKREQFFYFELRICAKYWVV